MFLTRLTTRIVILLLIVAALWISKDSLLRRAVVSSAESVVGARVEIGHLRSDLNEHRVYLQQVAIADPRDPMKNLIQADHVTLDLDPQAILRRRWVAEHGTATQVRFGAPRTRSGAIGETNLMPSGDPIESAMEADEQSRLYERWTSQFNRRTLPDVAGLTKNMDQVVAEWQTTWPTWLSKQEEVVSDLRTQIIQFHTELEKKGTNPLRHHVSAETLQARHRELNVLLQQASEKIAHFRTEAERERERLQEAAERDRQRVVDSITGTQIDPAIVHQTVLESTIRDQLLQMVEWFDEFRGSIPDPQLTFDTAPRRGVDHPPEQIEPSPSFLIRNLEIDGEGRFAGQHFNFSGTLENLTTEPKKLDQPIRFQLQAQGNALIKLSGSIDRRGQKPVDRLVVDCPRLQLDARKWGVDSIMTASMTPTRLTATVELQSTDKNISGEIHLSYDELMLQLDQLNMPGSLADILTEVNMNLASLNRFQVAAKVSGSVDAPKIEIESDLGEKLAQTINSVIAKHQQRELDAYGQMITERRTEYLQRLEQQIIAPLELVAASLASERARLVQMAEAVPEPSQDGFIRR